MRKRLGRYKVSPMYEIKLSKLTILVDEPEREMQIGARKRRTSESNSAVSTKRPRLSSAGESCAKASTNSYPVAPSEHDTLLTYFNPAHGLLSMSDISSASTSSLGYGASDDVQVGLYTYTSWDRANRKFFLKCFSALHLIANRGN